MREMKNVLFAALFASVAGCWYSGADCVKACGDKGVLLCAMDRVVCNPYPSHVPENKGDAK